MGNDWLQLCILTSRYLQNCHFSLWLLYSCHFCDISKKPLTNHYSLGRGQCRQWGGGGGGGGLPCKQCICIVISPPILPLISIALIVICRETSILCWFTHGRPVWISGMKWAFQCCGLVPQYTGKCAVWSTKSLQSKIALKQVATINSNS